MKEKLLNRSDTSDGYSHRAIWNIALPMILSSISVPVLGLVDTAVMGHLDGPWYLAAVAAGATVFSVLFMGMNFLRMGTTGITAQAFGADNDAAIGESLVQPLIIATVLAIALIILQVPVIRAALWLLGTSATTAGYIHEYFSIRIWSSPASLWNFVVIGWLLGMQNARGPLTIILTINSCNIVLDLVFVLIFGMDVAGVALATVIAELAGVAVGTWFVANAMRDHKFVWEPEKYLVLARYRAIFMINGNLFVRTMALMFSFAFITAQGARLGDHILAANAILMNFQFFLSYALDGIAHAAEALTGKATGARNRTGLTLAVNRTLFWSTALAGLFVITYWVAGETIINLLTDQPLIRDTAHTYLPWLIVLPLLSVWSFLYDGVFVGTTRSREMRMVMTGALLLVFLPTWYLFQHLGNHALWLAFTLFMTARSLGMHIWYRRLHSTNQLMPG